MLGPLTDALNLPSSKTKRSNDRWFLLPARFICAGFLLCTEACVMTRAEGERLSFQVHDLESEMAKMQRVRHDMEILLSGQKKLIDRLGQLEKQLSALRDSLVDGHTKNTELTAEIQDLRNQLEEAQNRYRLLEADQRDLAKNQQALKEEKKRAPKGKSEHFALAKRHYNEEKFEDAISLFEQYVATYPNDSELPQAYYFLAESCNKQAQKEEIPEESSRFYKKAVVAYQEIAERFAQSGLREEALFKMGGVLKAMGNKEAAMAAFKEVISKHKGSKRSIEAKAQLSELEKAQ